MKQVLSQPESRWISSRKWRDLFDAVYTINIAENQHDFMDATLAALRRLIPADLYCVHLADRLNGQVTARMAPENPFTPEEVAYYAAEPSRMPLVAHYERTGDTCARRVSDIVSRKEWISSKYYRICMARLGLVHCISLPVRVDENTVAGLSMNRKRGDFGQNHCELLNAFAPHLRLAWQRQVGAWPKNSCEEEITARGCFEKLGLSLREAEVLYWMTEGKQNREIATILERSLATIQEHVSNIVRKLDQENRHSATVFALRVRQQQG